MFLLWYSASFDISILSTQEKNDLENTVIGWEQLPKKAMEDIRDIKQDFMSPAWV
jgi:hypothetical protein